MFFHGAEILFNNVKQSKPLSESRKQRLYFLSFKSAERNTPTHSAWLTPSKDPGHSHQALVVNKTGRWLYHRFPLKEKNGHNWPMYRCNEQVKLILEHSLTV